MALLVPALCALLPQAAQAGDPGKWHNPYSYSIVDRDGRRLDVTSTPSRPPDVKMDTALLPASGLGAGSNSLAAAPAFTWCYGCSPTAAAMLAGYFDQPARGYARIYSGPAGGGICPLNNEAAWGHTVYPHVTCGECPLSATHLGYDGLATRGHVDDFWLDFGSMIDPYWGNWPQHTYSSCTADYMGASQWHNWQNTDGSTIFFWYTDNSPLYDYTGGEPGLRDGCHGIRLFIESRGYSVTSNYNQYIYGRGGIPAGFTYSQFKAQIDAGRPVLIQVTGHTMLGVGYSDPGTIYVHNTWDNAVHSMPWGGAYSGRQHYGVTVVEPAPPAPLLASPAEGAAVGTDTTLAWLAAFGATRYRIEVNSDAAWGAVGRILHKETGDALSYTLTGLTGGTKYWRVWAGNTSGWCSDADAAANGKSFTVATGSAISTAPPRHGSSPSVPAVLQQTVALPAIYVQTASLSASQAGSGAPVTVTASVCNRGSVNGASKVVLYIDGREEDSRAVAVESGGTLPVTFTVSRSRPGEYAVYVDGTPAGSFRVDGPVNPDVMLFVSLAFLLAALLLGAVYLRVYRQKERICF